MTIIYVIFFGFYFDAIMSDFIKSKYIVKGLINYCDQIKYCH